jgi:hypothetical protein
MHAQLSNPNITFIPTTQLTRTHRHFIPKGWYEERAGESGEDLYFRLPGEQEGAIEVDIVKEDPSYAPIHGMMRRWSYQKMREEFPVLDEDYLLPDEEEFCPRIQEAVRRQWIYLKGELPVEASTLEVSPVPDRKPMRPPINLEDIEMRIQELPLPLPVPDGLSDATGAA